MKLQFFTGTISGATEILQEGYLPEKLCYCLPIIFLFIHSFILWLRWVFVAARGLSLVAVSGGYSSLRCTGFSLPWLLLLRSTGSRHAGFSSCGMWAQ